MSILAAIRLVCFGSLLFAGTAHAQQDEVDPNRVFTTPLHWHRVAGAPRSGPLRVADGSLAILYRDGTYAAVTASFLRSGKDGQVALNLGDDVIVRLGTWTKTDDDMIRIESREIYRDVRIKRMTFALEWHEGQPIPQEPPPGPISARTCRLDKPSVEHLSDMIHCNGGAGLTLVHPIDPVDLADFPKIVQALRKAER